MGLYKGHHVLLAGIVHEVALVLGHDEGVLTQCNQQRVFIDPETFRDYLTREVLTCLWCVTGTSR